MGYEIRVVSNEEFDCLPYKRAKSSLGLADPKTNVAYVRETGIRELDEETINHEFDELIAKVSPHEEDGIRYKSGGSLGSILAPVLGAAITILSAGTLAPLGVAVGAMGSAGTSQYSKSVKPEKYGKPGQFGDIAKSAIIGGLGAYGGGQAGLGAVSGFKSAAPGFLSKAGGTIGGALGMGGGSGAASKAGTAGTGGGVFGSGAGGAGAGAGAGAGTGTAAGTSGGLGGAITRGIEGASKASALRNAAPAGQSLLSKFGSFASKAVDKAAPMVLANTATSAIQQPQQAPLTDVLDQSLYPSSRTPASNTGSTLDVFNPSLLGNSNYAPITQNEYDTGLTNLAQAKQSGIADLFRTPAFRGQTPEENTKLANLLSELNKGYDQRLSQYDSDIASQNLSRRYKSVQEANKLSTQQMNEFIALAKQPDANISARVTNSPAEFRNIFKDLIPV